MKRITLALTLLALAAAPARGFEEETVKAAIARLEGEKALALHFYNGFSGSKCSPSIALLVILSDKEALKTFTALADKPGAPGLYGLSACASPTGRARSTRRRPRNSWTARRARRSIP